MEKKHNSNKINIESVTETKWQKPNTNDYQVEFQVTLPLMPLRHSPYNSMLDLNW